MTRDDIDSTLDSIIQHNEFLPFDAKLYCNVLADDLATHAFELPESTRGMLLAMAAGLKKLAIDTVAADIRADMAVSKARGVAPAITLVDHTFVIEVTFDPECNMWVGVCNKIGLVTEAESFEALEQRAMLILGDLAIENEVMTPNETAQVIFQHQSAVA